MRQLIEEFIESMAKGELCIYNEFSLQHELGIFIRANMPDHKVQFERNVSYFFSDGRQSDGCQFTKKEIDTSVFTAQREELCFGIELKYPRNGQYPEQMFNICEDLAFVEQLKLAGFRESCVLIFVDDRLFYEGSANGIYGYFRGGQELHGIVRKPTGKRDKEVQIRGNYRICWQPAIEGLRYACIEADSTYQKR